MSVQRGCLLISRVVLMVFTLFLGGCGSHGVQYTVGDSAWSIPLTPHFYTNWSSSHSFRIGDTLLFDFESELHNVMLVSRSEYDSCTADNPYRAFKTGPATVPLIDKGLKYFVCSVANYCALGQKIQIAVQEASPGSAPVLLPSPPLLPFSASLEPDEPQPSDDDVAYASKAPDSVDLPNGVLLGWTSVLRFVTVLVFEWFL